MEQDPGPQSLVVDKTLLIADNVQNMLIAAGPPEQLEMLDALLDKIDQRPRQIKISAVIAQLTLGDDFEFGLDFLRTLDSNLDEADPRGAGIFKARTGTAQTILDPATLVGVENFLPAAQGLSLYGQINQYYNAYVSALEATNRLEILSRPTVYTMNNRRATITTGQRVAVPRSTSSVLDPNAATTNQVVTASIDFENVLLAIEVTPLINAEDEVTLRISQTNDDIVGTQLIGGDQVPTIGTQTLQTTVIVPNKSTVL
ncbi:MAG: hypothetical protein AAF585_19140, partial [Verrucomicrobiota bacterium]